MLQEILRDWVDMCQAKALNHKIVQSRKFLSSPGCCTRRAAPASFRLNLLPFLPPHVRTLRPLPRSMPEESQNSKKTTEKAMQFCSVCWNQLIQNSEVNQ